MSVVHDASKAGPANALAADAAGTGAGNPPLSPDARHLALLERAVTACLSPLEYPDMQAWGSAVGGALAALAGGRGGAIMLPGGALEWIGFGSLPRGTRAEGQPLSFEEATERLGVADGDLLGGIVWARDALGPGEGSGPPTPSRRECTGVGIRVRAMSGAVAAVYVQRDPELDGLPDHVLPAFRAVAPAFQAGANAWLSAAASRSTVQSMIDSLSEAAMLFDAEGTAVHANSAMERLASPAASRLREEAQRVAWSLGALSRRRSSVAGRATCASSSDAASTRTIRVGSLVYRLRGSVVGEHLSGSRPAVLVTVTATATEPLSDEALHAQYGLTPREVQVARLIAEGLSNSEIGERLGVRFFTARNHVERTLAKLGVASRHRVGPLLRNEVGETERSGRATAA